MSTELKQYIHEALSKGASKEHLNQILHASGWSTDVIQKTLEQYVGVDALGLPIPAPRMQAHQIARDLFAYLLIFVTLTMSAVGLGGILFDLINHHIPDRLMDPANGRWISNSINWAISQLLVAFPIFLALTAWINRELVKHPEKRESLIRKLMIYFMLVITAITALGDLACTLTTFLNGDLTLRFTSKAFVILGISAIIFTYYLFEVRQDDRLVKSEGASA